MASPSKEDPSPNPRKLSCSGCFDALWFCYSPVYQMQQYYRLGTLDNCADKWSALYDCLSLKTKRSSEVQAVFVRAVTTLISDFNATLSNNFILNPKSKYMLYDIDTCPMGGNGFKGYTLYRRFWKQERKPSFIFGRFGHQRKLQLTGTGYLGI